MEATYIGRDIALFEGAMIDGIRKWKKKGMGEWENKERKGWESGKPEGGKPILARFVSILPRSWEVPPGNGGNSAKVD